MSIFSGHEEAARECGCGGCVNCDPPPGPRATPAQIAKIHSLLSRALPAHEELAERIAEFQRDVSAVANFVAAVPGVHKFSVACEMTVSDMLFDALDIIGVIKGILTYTVNYGDGRVETLTTAYVFDAESNIPEPRISIQRENPRATE